MATVPTLQDLEQAKKDTVDINTFTLSTEYTFVDNKGRTRKTIAGVINDVDVSVDDKLIEGRVYPVPRFSGVEFTTPFPVTIPNIFIDGRFIEPADYSISEDKTTVTLNMTVNTTNSVVIVTPLVGSVTSNLVVYETVQEMILNFGSSVHTSCVTLSYNKPVVSIWHKRVAGTNTGAGDMSDGTLFLNGGSLVELQIENIMDVRAFGTYGDYVPYAETYEHDDSTAIQNAINNCDRLISRAEDTFAIAKHIRTKKYNQIIDFELSDFFWFGQSGAPLAVGRDRAMFEVFGDFGVSLGESGPWEVWREGADTFPADDTSVILEHDYILMTVGRLPDEPGETYMVRPMLADPRKTNTTTRFQTDYRLGWDHVDADFRYFSVSPAKNVHIKLNKVVDMTDYDYDERDVDGNRKSASATSMVYAANCSIKINESDNFQYPTIMTYVVSDCEVRDCFLLPSTRESDSGIYGWGIIVQWNTALRPRSYNLSAQGNRRCLDYTQVAYAHAENIGGESTRDGEMTTHGVYEHNLTYVNTRGFMSFAASGPDFGETSKNITVLHHHGSDVFAVRNVQNLSLTDVRANSIRVNSVGLRMDNCSLYDSGRLNIDNLCQISNFSKAVGKPYPNDSAVISNSSLGSNGVVYLVDQEIGSNETIVFNDCDLYLREGDFAGPANVIINGGTIRPKPSEVNNGRLILVSNPTSLRISNVFGYNIGFSVPDSPFIVNGPVNVDISNSKFVGEAFAGAFWANTDEGNIQDNRVNIHNVEIDWDNNTDSGIFYDPLKARNNSWLVSVTDCRIYGKNNEELRIPAPRGNMRFGNNTLSNITKSIDTLSATRIEYNTLER